MGWRKLNPLVITRKRAGTDALGPSPQITSGMTAEMRERVQQALNTRLQVKLIVRLKGNVQTAVGIQL
jgi:hypothetical protein